MVSPTLKPRAAWKSSMMTSLGPVKGPPERKMKGRKALYGGVVDTVDVFETLAGGELDIDGGGDGDVREGAEDIRDLDGGGGSRHADEVGDGSGVRDHVHADAAGAGALAVEHAEHDGCDGEDHDDFDRNGEGADERAQRTMDEIADNQFVHTSNSVWELVVSMITATGHAVQSYVSEVTLQREEGLFQQMIACHGNQGGAEEDRCKAGKAGNEMNRDTLRHPNREAIELIE